VSYETFRLHAERFLAPESCDLLICDEAHRLKNDQTLTNRALASLACRRRVLLSGTPMQNQLQEFYSMVNFCNPGVLGTPAQFRKQYEAPILAGREPDASDTDRERGAERSSELSTIVNEFILRRTNNLLSAHLPPKVVEVVCCRMTPLQYELYCHFVQSRSVRSLFASQKSARVLSAITSLRKLLNHPKLIYDMVQSSSAARSSDPAANGFAGAGEIFPPGIFDAGRGNRGSLPPGWENLSGKFAVVSRMLALLREQTKDRVVIVSNYTQTLDLFTSLCRERGYPCLRLDGSTSISKRQKLVKIFNDPADNQFVFLLSSKAGGCGLNLVGGNRLILFDMSWNPADDKQAAARVWRDGQRRRVYVYRFMTTGTIEEKVYQRQLSKEGLQAVVDTKSESGASSALMSVEELRDLFSYDPDTLSTTYDHMVAGSGRRKAGKVLSEGHDIGSDDEDQDLRLQEEHPSAAAESLPPKSAELAALGPILSPQNGKPKEEDLAAWGHHSEATTVPDEVMKLAGGEDVTFVFSCQVDGREVPEDPPLVPLGQGKAVGAVGKEGDTAGPATKSLARRTVPSGNAGSTRPAFKAPSFNAPAVVAAAVASASVKPSSQRVEKAPLQGQGSSQQRVQPKINTAAATAVSKEVAAPRGSRPSQNAKTVPDDGGGACCALVAEERTGVLTATPVPGPGQTQQKPPPMPKIAVTAPVVQRKSTAGVKRRSNGAPSCGGSAPSGTQKKRVTITYDSDDDFK
jgi:DNA repair and recombination protein RAD54 and RAD54-like protein